MSVFDLAWEDLTAEAARELSATFDAFLNNANNRGHYYRAVGSPAKPTDTVMKSVLRGYLEEAEHSLNHYGVLIERELGRLPRNILDVGCSVGHVSLAASYRWPGASLLGCDVEPEAIGVARCLCRTRPGVRFLTCAAENLPSSEGPFDLILCSSVLEHCFEPKRFVHRLVQLLEPGGVMHLYAPNYLFPWEPHVRTWRVPGGKLLLRVLLMMTNRAPSFVDHLHFEVNPIRVKRWLRAAGPVTWQDLNEDKIQSVLLGTWNGLSHPRLVSFLKRTGLNRSVAHILRLLPLTPSVHLLVRKCAERLP